MLSQKRNFYFLFLIATLALIAIFYLFITIPLDNYHAFQAKEKIITKSFNFHFPSEKMNRLQALTILNGQEQVSFQEFNSALYSLLSYPNIKNILSKDDVMLLDRKYNEALNDEFDSIKYKLTRAYFETGVDRTSYLNSIENIQKSRQYHMAQFEEFLKKQLINN